jgi:hypothetical protein
MKLEKMIKKATVGHVIIVTANRIRLTKFESKIFSNGMSRMEEVELSSKKTGEKTFKYAIELALRGAEGMDAYYDRRRGEVLIEKY